MNDRTEWIEELTKQCAASSQSRVAAKLRQRDGFPSPTLINQVLKEKYPGRKERLQALVEGMFMNRVVECPIQGEIPADQCEEYQARPFASTNPIRIKLYQACRNGCPYSRVKEES